jgi:putative flippase GtrA
LIAGPAAGEVARMVTEDALRLRETTASAMPSHTRTLTRSTLVSIAATASEFVLLPVLVNLLHVSEAICYAAVQFVAQAITFTCNKYWAFDAAQVGSLHGQGVKSLLVFGGSLALNTALPSFGSYVLHLPPVGAFAISQVVVYLSWNYPMNRYWVFRRPREPR